MRVLSYRQRQRDEVWTQLYRILDEVPAPPGGSRHQGWRIDSLEPVVGEADDLLFAKYLQRPADVNVGKTQSLADMALAQRQLYDLSSGSAGSRRRTLT
jgi:hypothetical protein